MTVIRTVDARSVPVEEEDEAADGDGPFRALSPSSDDDAEDDPTRR